METKSPTPITPFDEMTTPASLRMLKLFLPYAPPSMQKTLAFFIRFQEMKSTITFFQQNRCINKDSSSSNPDFLQTIFKDLAPFLRPEEKEMTENFQNIIQMMEMVQSMSNPEDVGQFFNLNSFFDACSPSEFSQDLFDDKTMNGLVKAASEDIANTIKTKNSSENPTR